MTELLDPPQYEKLVAGCRRIGLSDRDVHYYAEHITVDIGHADGWLNNVIVPIGKNIRRRWRSTLAPRCACKPATITMMVCWRRCSRWTAACAHNVPPSDESALWPRSRRSSPAGSPAFGGLGLLGGDGAIDEHHHHHGDPFGRLWF